jgi:hypothetical protein
MRPARIHRGRAVERGRERRIRDAAVERHVRAARHARARRRADPLPALRVDALPADAARRADSEGWAGFGPIHREDDLLIGSGFIDAYEAAEKRPESWRDICAVLVSSSFMLSLPNKKRAYQLLCFYEGRFYVHPWGLVDPQLGEFDPARILELLGRSGINQRKLEATRHFLENLEDYEAAMLPGSKTRKLREALGQPWRPGGKPEERP